MKGLGNDIIETRRISDAIETYGSKFLSRLFTEKEISYCMNFLDSPLRFAGRFAAKEAISKALGVGFGQHLKWKDIEILNEASGKPTVRFSPQIINYFKNPHVIVSISHCKKFASAVAVWID